MAKAKKAKKPVTLVTRQTPKDAETWLEWAQLVRDQLAAVNSDIDWAVGEIEKPLDKKGQDGSIKIDIEAIEKRASKNRSNYDIDRLGGAITRLRGSVVKIARDVAASHALEFDQVELEVGNLVVVRGDAEFEGVWSRLTRGASHERSVVLPYNDMVGEALQKHTMRGRGLKQLAHHKSLSRAFKRAYDKQCPHPQYGSHKVRKGPEHVRDIPQEERTAWHEIQAWDYAIFSDGTGGSRYYVKQDYKHLIDGLKSPMVILEIYKNMVVVQGQRKWVIHKDLLHLVQSVNLAEEVA